MSVRVQFRVMVGLGFAIVLSPYPNPSYICPVCLKSLNQVPGVFAVKGSGSVFCSNCFHSVLKKEMIDPKTNASFTLDDLVELEAEATSFSSRAKDKAEATRSDTPAPRFG